MERPEQKPGEKKGALLSFARYDSPLGPVRIVADGGALVAVSFLQGFHALKDHLASRFGRQVMLREDRAELGAVLALFERYFRGADVDFSSIRVKTRGSAFERRVWRALRAIPYGEVRSYAEVAAVIGSPRACRAVAGACARNKLPIIIPCHRVIRSDGGVGEWSGGGGVEIKKGLLAIEGKVI